ncbi:MAG: response regulator transcription factor [Saprospiraceae bacterium]|nr:response regulator transcription factor [Bacteroidia bacterium]NNE15839.1 response regulator transcription factor [Saprospiraceae bacterium]NNL92906.1 response regulator transcription factor [Saprospiraceae bacterium]
MEKKLKVLIVEDEVLIAKHIEDTLLSNNFLPIGIAHDSETALDYIANRSPEFVILDINIDGNKDGIEVAEVLKANYDIPFMFLTALSDIQTLDRAKKVNPSGYIVKPFKTRDLISSITIGLYNYEFKKSDNSLSLEQVNEKAVDPLSQKEYDVLLDITEGFTNAQIAKKQFVSLSTIKFHSQNIYSKLGVNNRTSAIKKVLGL